MGLEEHLPRGFLLTTVEKVAGYAQARSVWPATFGLACCATEMMHTFGPRHDLARFGMGVSRNTPRQTDLMIVAGRVSQKIAPVLRQIYDQMPDPKWVISMGVCASSGGMFNNYGPYLTSPPRPGPNSRAVKFRYPGDMADSRSQGNASASREDAR